MALAGGEIGGQVRKGVGSPHAEAEVEEEIPATGAHGGELRRLDRTAQCDGSPVLLPRAQMTSTAAAIVSGVIRIIRTVIAIVSSVIRIICTVIAIVSGVIRIIRTVIAIISFVTGGVRSAHAAARHSLRVQWLDRHAPTGDCRGGDGSRALTMLEHATGSLLALSRRLPSAPWLRSPLPRLRSRLPHLHRDWGSPPQHLHRDWAARRTFHAPTLF